MIFYIFRRTKSNNLESMKQKQQIIILLLLVLPIIGKSQNAMLKTIDDVRFSKMIQGEHFGIQNLSLKDIQGSPYLEDQFVKGTVFTTKNDKYVDVPLRYDQYQDELQFEKDGKAMTFSPRDIVKRAEFGNRVFTYTTYQFTDSKTKEGYFEILADGNVRLLSQHTIKFFEKEKEKPYVDPKPARFDWPLEDFYIQVGALPAQHITKKKNLLEAFPKHHDEVARYYKSNKLSAKDKADLIKLVQYYNSLN
ncbi:hypothetical protein SD074_13170 [Prolixibacter sp. SD074]|nr:hypothetical protein SD074_13170 [Prolixibacter sp. SD074]